jgi:hypothetical protein
MPFDENIMHSTRSDVRVGKAEGEDMKRNFVIAAGVTALCMTMGTALAQVQGAPGGGATGPGGTVLPGNQQGSGNLTQGDFNKLQEYADTARRLTAEDKAKGKTLVELLAEDKAAAGAVVTAMPLACNVNEAVLAAQGDVTADGKTIKTSTYEAACTNGMGYFLISPSEGKASAVTCYGADALRAADVAAGRNPGAVCGAVKANADLNAMSTAILTAAGKSCTAKDHRYVGRNAVTHTEYDEVACSDNSGYMLALALAGSTAPVGVSTCHDSTANGIPCKLSDNGTPAITAQTFLDALSQHSVACDANNNSDIHALGQESKQKRYVVEFRCSQRPQGTVAFIPLADNKAPFEVLDCAQAAKRQAVCTLKK